MTWLLITILAYFLLAVVFLVDKHLLVSAIPNPKVYAFLTGIAGVFLLALIPFVNFYIPDNYQLILSFFAGGSFVFALYYFFKALQIFNVSQVVPAIGALSPLFTFILVYVFSFGREALSLSGIFSFILLIAGSILITINKEKSVTLVSLKLSFLAAFLFSLSFVLTKYVYLSQPFLNGLIWTRMGGVLAAMIFFIFCPDIKKSIFFPKNNLSQKTLGIVTANQLVGAGAGLLQNWAIALAPLAYIAFISALQGTQYAFLLVLTIFLSIKFPKILNEEISKEILFQKIIAILLIGGGLTLLASR